MHKLDLTNMMCPMPVLKTKKFLSTLASGEQVEILTTDPDSEKDLQDFCRKTGNVLIKQQVSTKQIITTIQRR